MKSTLDAHPEGDTYYLTNANVPAKMGVDGHLHEYRTPGVPLLPVRDSRGATTVGRFEFLAHLAALTDDSTLYTVGDVAIAVRGFAGGQGWAFEPDPERDPMRGTVRLATRAELDAEGSDAAMEVDDRAHFVDVAMYGRPASDGMTSGGEP